MTKRYAPVKTLYTHKQLIRESGDGEFVHFSDYENLVKALRFLHKHGDSLAKEVAEAALLSAGEELTCSGKVS